MTNTDKRETAREDTRPPLPQTITCEGCDAKVDPLNPNCRCFRG